MTYGQKHPVVSLEAGTLCDVHKLILSKQASANEAIGEKSFNSQWN